MVVYMVNLQKAKLDYVCVSIPSKDSSCLKCHIAGPSGYPVFNIWVGLSDSANFHSKEDIQTCKSCHGKGLIGGIT